VTRTPIITAYRQSALRLVASLEAGQSTTKEIRAATGVAEASTILQRNVYGWFDRTSRGVYALSPVGHEAAELYRDVIKRVVAADVTPRDQAG
jgi:hypothetical protein